LRTAASPQAIWEKSFSRLIVNSLWAACAAALRAMMWTSKVAGSWFRWVRKNSRHTRLSRFRVTAGPTFLVTVIPSREPGWSHGAYMTMKCLLKRRCPSCPNCRYAGRFRIRLCLGSPCRKYFAFALDLASPARFYRRSPCLHQYLEPLPRLSVFDRQAFASFGTAAIDNGPSAFGRHPFTKTVRAGTFDATGLIGSFH
jgi:hypothetical protein